MVVIAIAYMAESTVNLQTADKQLWRMQRGRGLPLKLIRYDSKLKQLTLRQLRRLSRLTMLVGDSIRLKLTSMDCMLLKLCQLWIAGTVAHPA